MMVSWLHHALASVVAGSGPSASDASARALVADLRQQAKRATEIAREISGLEHCDIEGVRLDVVSRLGWVSRAREGAQAMLKSVNHPVGDLALTPMLALAARRVLGQFDPFAPEPRLTLVAPNIYHLREVFDLDRRDLALWVSVHEMTHAIQFAAAPWLKDVIISRLRQTLADKSGARDELGAVLSLLGGHAQFVMNSVPSSLIPSRRPLAKVLQTHRKMRGTLETVLSGWVGLAHKIVQYDQGKNFVEAVVAEGGMQRLNKIWQNPLHLPLTAELESPQLWMARV
ncbi:zinc-dependent metalloprotease [Arcanobacterium canis]